LTMDHVHIIMVQGVEVELCRYGEMIAFMATEFLRFVVANFGSQTF